MDMLRLPKPPAALEAAPLPGRLRLHHRGRTGTRLVLRDRRGRVLCAVSSGEAREARA